MNLKPHHIALKVQDLEKCEHFYTGVLGLESMQRLQDENGHIRSVWFDLGGVILMLERGGKAARPAGGETDGSGTEVAGWHLLALTISPKCRGEWREKLRLAGVAITSESNYSIYFCDPENNQLALSHYPEPASGSS